MGKTSLVALFFTLVAQVATADDYQIKLERVVLPMSQVLIKRGGFQIPPDWKGKPEQTIEVRVEPGSPFDVRLAFGEEGIEFRGALSRVPETSDARIEFRYAASIRYPVEGGPLESRRVQTAIQLSPGKTLKVAEFIGGSGNDEVYELLRLTACKTERFDNESAREFAYRKHGTSPTKRRRIRISDHGYRNVKEGDPEPSTDVSQHSLSFTTELDKPFQVRARFAKIELNTDGLLFAGDQPNQLDVAITVEKIHYSGILIENPVIEGAELKDSTRADSTLCVKSNESIVLGGMETIQDKLRSKDLLYLRITEMLAK